MELTLDKPMLLHHNHTIEGMKRRVRYGCVNDVVEEEIILKEMERKKIPHENIQFQKKIIDCLRTNRPLLFSLTNQP